MAKILVADDDRDVRLMLRILLESSGYEVIEAVDGAEAVALTIAEEPVVVVLDQMMPGATGLETLPALRKASADLGVVMYSAIRGSLDRAPGPRADRYVDKGDVEELVAVVGELVARAAS